MTAPTDTSIVLAAVTTDSMTTDQLEHRTMLSKSRLVAAIQELVNRGLLFSKGVDSYGTKPGITNKEGTKMAAATKKAAAKKASSAKKAPAVATKKAVRGEAKHLKVAERDTQVFDLIKANKEGLTDAEIAKAVGVSEGIAYQSIRRLSADKRISSAKSENGGKTRRHAVK